MVGDRWALLVLRELFAGPKRVYLVGEDADLATRGRWLLQAMATTAGTLPRGIVTTNFVLDGEESSLAVTTEGVEARDGLDAGAQLTIRGTARDLHRIATSANKGKAHSKRFIVDGDRRSADRLLGHLAEGIRRAAAAPVDSAHLPKGGGPRISMPPFRAAEARTRSKSTGADASRAGVSVSLAPR